MYSNKLMHALLKLTVEEKEYFSYYRKAGNEVVTEVSEMLQANGEFKISRKLIAGSIGKGTALGIESEPDFDVVLFVNEVKPPMTKVVAKFKSILLQAPSGRFLNIRTTRHSLQFSVERILALPTGAKQVRIDFDILPAANFVEGANRKRQAQRALKKIRDTGRPTKDWYLYSPSLSEETVHFIKNLPEFDHNVIRLAKLWDQRLKDVMGMEKKSYQFSGRSSVIELVAAKAAKDVTRGFRRSTVLEAFRRFLNLMRRFDKIDVDFIDSGDESSEVSSDDEECRRIIRDPINPHNNYAARVRQYNIQHFKKWASRTRKAVNATAKSAHDEDYRANLRDLKATYFGKD